MSFEWLKTIDWKWVIGIVLGLMMFLLRFIPWWKDRQEAKQVKQPDISVMQNDSQRKDSDVFLLEDGTVFTNASFSLSNDSLVPVQIKSFILNEHHMIRKQGQFVDGSNQFRLASGKVMQNRAKPSTPKLPCAIQPKAPEDFWVWFETRGLAAPDQGDMTARLTVKYDKNLLTSFTIFIHRYNELQ